MEKTESNQQTDNKILGTEKVGKLLVKFAVPCILSLVIQALYNIVDQIFIGNAGNVFRNPEYLQYGNSATGIVFPLTVVALAIALFIGDGTASCLSLNQGKNQTENTHKSVGTGLSVGLIASIILMIVCFAACEPILKLFGASGEGAIYLPDAKEYSTFIFAGFAFYILGTIMNPIIRADGSPRFAMIAMIAGAVTNIALDPILLYAAKMGMTGAAIATFAGQAVTFLVEVVYFFKPKTFKLKIKSFIPDFKLLGASLKLGVSSFLTQMSIVIIATVSNIMIGKYFVAGAQNATGIFNVVFKFYGIAVNVVIGVSIGSQPIIGYNYGAGKYDRVKNTFKTVLLVTLVLGAITTILFETCPQYILAMFGYAQPKNTAAEIAFGVNAFRIYCGFVLITFFIKSVSIFFQSIGYPVRSTALALLRDVIFLVPLSICLPMIKPEVFFWAAPISDVLAVIVAIALLVLAFKNMPKTAANEEEIAIKKSTQGVIITIAREHGAGGREIGQKLAEKLGIPYYDKEVAMLTAKESGLATEFVENVEDKSSLLYSLYMSTEANQTAVAAQSAVLKKIADEGACVIVGRAADWVLREYNPCKVLVYAPADFKVKRIMQNYGDDEKQAKINMEKSDKRRAKFYKNITGQDWANRENYNLAIDSSVGIDKAVEIIASYCSAHAIDGRHDAVTDAE